MGKKRKKNVDRNRGDFQGAVNDIELDDLPFCEINTLLQVQSLCDKHQNIPIFGENQDKISQQLNALKWLLRKRRIENKRVKLAWCIYDRTILDKVLPLVPPGTEIWLTGICPLSIYFEYFCKKGEGYIVTVDDSLTIQIDLNKDIKFFEAKNKVHLPVKILHLSAVPAITFSEWLKKIEKIKLHLHNASKFHVNITGIPIKPDSIGGPVSHPLRKLQGVMCSSETIPGFPLPIEMSEALGSVFTLHYQNIVKNDDHLNMFLIQQNIPAGEITVADRYVLKHLFLPEIALQRKKCLKSLSLKDGKEADYDTLYLYKKNSIALSQHFDLINNPLQLDSLGLEIRFKILEEQAYYHLLDKNPDESVNLILQISNHWANLLKVEKIRNKFDSLLSYIIEAFSDLDKKTLKEYPDTFFSGRHSPISTPPSINTIEKPFGKK